MDELLPPPAQQYNFRFEEGLPDLICQEIIASIGEPSSRLPVLQVICDRLYSSLHADQMITGEAYRAHGACNAQVTSHIEEEIVRFFTTWHNGKISLAKQTDKWKTVLAQQAERQADGRIRAKPAIPWSEWVKLANDEKCADVPGMLDWLAVEENYILEKVQRPGCTEAYARLLHDSVAAALILWQDSDRAIRNRPLIDLDSILERPRPSEQDSILEAGSPSELPAPANALVLFNTINDLIWDHQLILYAQSRGFSQCLGLEFKAEPEFDLTQTRGKIDYEAFVSRPPSGVYRLLIMPGVILPAIEHDPWVQVGIPNIYRGYAIIGQQRSDLKPPVELAALARVLATQETKIGVFDQKSKEFVSLLFEQYGFEPNCEIKLLGVDAAGNPVTTTKDLMFTALVSREIDFGLGPAPARALAEQAGFPMYADFESFYKVADTARCAALKKLLMHEILAVDVPLTEEAILLRLVALLHYTVDHVRRNPEDFVSFLHDQMLLALNDGAYWLQRAFIRKSAESCYSYSSSNDFAFRYLTPGSRDFYRGPKSKLLVVHKRWLQLRAECDGLISQVLKEEPSTWTPNVKGAFERGQRLYRIYNYYDAWVEFQDVAKILSDRE